jgi:signal transduction histidine kinase
MKGAWVRAILPLRDGGAWVSMQSHGLFRIAGGQWSYQGGLTGLPRVRAHVLASDGGGRTWIGFVTGHIACIDGQQVSVYGEADGLKLGNIQSLLVDGKYLWAGGEYGLAYFDGKRWVTAAAALRGISGMTRMSDGELWLHGAEGVTRVGAVEVARVLAQPGRMLIGERFDGLDGLGSGAEQVAPLPSLIHGSDGRLWFTSAGQVASMDPRRILRNRLAPPVQIISLQAHGRRYQGARIDLPVGTDELEISYTALGLRMPERIQFRYRLHGVDREWHDAGTRRDVMFNNLGPGTYRFQVIAANEDGVWNHAGAEVTVNIAPTFVQTRTFQALMAALAALILYSLYRLRLRQVTRRMHVLAHARLAERARIARGLHDTLLQSVQGLIMFFNDQARRLPHAAEERRKIDQTLALADQLMSEGRDYILDLRAAAEPCELGDALRAYGTVLLQERLAVAVPRQARELAPTVRDELYAIAREALFNAARHAQASRVEVVVDYGHDTLGLLVRDDGCGGACERIGHYGLCGMRERAEAIGAAFTLSSNPGGGTVLEIAIPGNRAYVRPASQNLLPRLRRRLGFPGAA